MRSSLRFAVGVIGLLGLLALGAACGDLSTVGPAYPGPETEGPAPTHLSATISPQPIIQPPPYPGIPEPGPTNTLPPERPPTLTPIPTTTPLPTALPLPPSAFDVLWVENIGLDGSSTGVIWRADPRDIANRREVARFDGREIYQAVLSPNGQQLALITKHRVQGGGPLWVMDLDGTNLRQLAPESWEIVWSQNGRTIFYEFREWGGDQAGIEQIDLASGEIQRVLTIERDAFMQLLGWSAGGQWLYYLRSSPEEYEEYQLWKVRHDGHDPQFIASLGMRGHIDLSQVSLSPNGSKLLVGTRSWISTDGQEKGTIQLPPGLCSAALWGHEENEVIAGLEDEGSPRYHLYAINIPSQHARELGAFDIPGMGWWQRLALSPDYNWLMAYLYGGGFYWVHLSTGTMVPLPCQNCGTRFVAWLPSGSKPLAGLRAGPPAGPGVRRRYECRIRAVPAVASSPDVVARCVPWGRTNGT